jgi:hypothetical protein
VVVVVVDGDSLPGYLYDSQPKMRLSDPVVHGDALLISRDLMMRAKTDPTLKANLERIAHEVPLFVYQATTVDLAELFDDESMLTSGTTTSTILVSFIKFENTAQGSRVWGTGSFAVPREEEKGIIESILYPPRDEEDFLLEGIKSMVRQNQSLGPSGYPAPQASPSPDAYPYPAPYP